MMKKNVIIFGALLCATSGMWAAKNKKNEHHAKTKVVHKEDHEARKTAKHAFNAANNAKQQVDHALKEAGAAQHTANDALKKAGEANQHAQHADDKAGKAHDKVDHVKKQHEHDEKGHHKAHAEIRKHVDNKVKDHENRVKKEHGHIHQKIGDLSKKVETNAHAANDAKKHADQAKKDADSMKGKMEDHQKSTESYVARELEKVVDDAVAIAEHQTRTIIKELERRIDELEREIKGRHNEEIDRLVRKAVDERIERHS